MPSLAARRVDTALRGLKAMASNRELRFFKGLQVREAKAGDGSIGTLEGYWAMYNVWSGDLGWFRERIMPGCFSKCLAGGQDVRCLVDHDTGKIIGRQSAKTLTLIEDDKGVRFENQLPDTTVGRDTLTSVRRGDLTGMSFCFETVTDKWSERTENGKTVVERDLIEANVYEISPVAFPAYEDTLVEARELRSARQVFDAYKAAVTPPAPDGKARRDRIKRAHELRRALWTGK